MRFNGDFNIKAFRAANGKAKVIDKQIYRAQELAASTLALELLSAYIAYMPRATGTYAESLLTLAYDIADSLTTSSALLNEISKRVAQGTTEGTLHYGSDNVGPTYPQDYDYNSKEDRGIAVKSMPDETYLGRAYTRSQYAALLESGQNDAVMNKFTKRLIRRGPYFSYVNMSFDLDNAMLKSYDWNGSYSEDAYFKASTDASQSMLFDRYVTILHNKAARRLGVLNFTGDAAI